MNNIESMLEQISAQAVVDACVQVIGRAGFAVNDATLVDVRRPGAKAAEPKLKPVAPIAGKSDRCPCGKPSFARDGTCRSCCQLNRKNKASPEPAKPVKPTPKPESELAARCQSLGCAGIATRVGLCLSCYRAQPVSAKAKLAEINARGAKLDLTAASK